jgi:hypothetical protein
MERFVHGLSSFSRACRADLTGFHVQEESLNATFRNLQRAIKYTLLGSQRPRRIDPGRSLSKLPQRFHAETSKLPPLEKATQRRSELQPVPFPVRSYALRAQQCRAAIRLYRPKARERIAEDRLELIDEYVNHPRPEVALMLDGDVDPALRVGNFHPNELKWNGPMSLEIV